MKAIKSIKIYKSSYKILTYLYATLPSKEVKRYILTIQKLFPLYKRDKIINFHHEELYWELRGKGFEVIDNEDKRFFEVDFVNKIIKN